jgi:fatty-acyl-CoA synthase
MHELEKRPANFVSMTPLDFLRRAALVYPDRIAVVDGAIRLSYARFAGRSRALAAALERAGVRPGDRVSALLPNGAAMLEAHYGVPGAGAVLNTINTRLDARLVGFILRHAESRVLLFHSAFAALVHDAIDRAGVRPRLVCVHDSPGAAGIGDVGYEQFLAEADQARPFRLPDDEWDSIALNYTSGTTGDPKGVVYSHRGAYLQALGNALTFQLTPQSRYLWTLPMFHCNGWSFPWAVTAVGACHIGLAAIDPAEIFRLIEAERVTHLCAAPVVLTMLIHAPDAAKRHFPHGPVALATGGAAPASATIAAIEELGFAITHLYGMTECYGPSTSCAAQEAWQDLPIAERALLMARQGVNLPTLADQAVLHTGTGAQVPHDGVTVGELALRGNTVMKGYFRNPRATESAFAGGWLHTGDLAVCHPDGYVEIKDRAKDLIISGGENISSLEVEEVLYRHPAVMEAAVVARPDPKWGETPCAFITLRPGEERADEAGIVAFCRDNLARFKVPRTLVFGPLPKTSTGKIQKFVLRERARAL